MVKKTIGLKTGDLDHTALLTYLEDLADHQIG